MNVVEINTNRNLNEENIIFSLDIGTRSIIGVVGILENEKVNIVAIEKEEHSNRAMIDGQIENIEQVAKVAKSVKEKLEKRLSCTLKKVCVAAAGRALKTEKASYELELPNSTQITEETISKLEAGAISNAEAIFCKKSSDYLERQFYLVGYTISQYYLDNYPISSLIDHHGKVLKADVIATFLPSEVVESLYITMRRIGLEVASLTLEPIAAINAAIPHNIRLLNLALVDIGAGTSDIAVCRDGSVVGYTMATTAGDEITEAIMKQYLVDFNTAELLKFQLQNKENIAFTDILGFEQTVASKDILACITDAKQRLCKEICDKIIEVNDGAPAAVFLAGGGSKLEGICEEVSACLGIEPKRVAIAGNNFQFSAFSNDYNLNNPEYATPLGIAISSGMNLINDSFRVKLNGYNAKLFRSGSLSVRDVLMMNGYTYQDLIGLSGASLIISVNGNRKVFYGTHSTPAVLKVNDINAKISDIINAGDSIYFEPAIHGKNAAATVADVVEYCDGLVVTVNGELAQPSTLLKTGDNVEVLFIKEEDESIIDEEQILMEYPVEVSAEEHIAEESPGVDKLEKQDLLSNEVIPINQDCNIEAKPELEEFSIPKEKEENISKPQEIQEPKKEIFTFKLNGRSLGFESKKDGRPYFLMDMLEYSGIDFDNPEGEVVLKVNGVDSFFQQILKNNDVIDIYCLKRI